MSLENVLGKINEEKLVAEQDLNLCSPRVLPYKKGQIDSAKERLETLYIDYKNELLRRAIFILVTGEESEEFANIAADEYNCFKLEGKTFYKEIASQISPQLYLNKSLNASLFDIMGNVLEDKMKNLDIISYNSLSFNAKYQRNVKSQDELVEVLKEAVNDTVGPEVIGLDALERISREAVNKNYKSKIVPILIYSNDENFILTISDSLRTLNPRVVRVSAGKTETNVNALINIKETDEEKVGQALKEIAANA